MIPKRIVQIWNDERIEDMIPSLQAAVATWKTLNPDYEHVYYSMRAARQFIADNYDADVLEAFDTLIPGAYKADLFRYCELYKNGGFYVDIKLSCVIPMDTLLENISDCKQLLSLDIYGNGILNGFFGLVSEHPLLLNCIKQCVSNVKARYYGISSLDVTGPRLMGKQFRLLNNLPIHTGDCTSLYNNTPNTKWLKAYSNKPNIISEVKTIDNKIVIHEADSDSYRKILPTCYWKLWAKRSIYTDSPPYVPPKRPTHLFLPRTLRR